MHAFDFPIEHGKVALNVGPDGLSRTHMEEVTTGDGSEIQIDLKSDSFQFTEYHELVLTVEKCAGKVLDNQTSVGYVYKNKDSGRVNRLSKIEHGNFGCRWSLDRISSTKLIMLRQQGMGESIRH